MSRKHLPAAVRVSIGGPQSGAARLKRSHDVLKIGNRTREPINASDHCDGQPIEGTPGQ
jgi:hypothetical protein